MAVGTDEGAVKADVAGPEGGHGGQLGGDEVLLHNAVLLVQQVQNGQLHPLRALVVLEGTAAHQHVQALAGNGLGQRLLALVSRQVGQQVVHSEDGIAGAGTDGHLDHAAVLHGDDAVELQGDGHPLVLADTAVIVGLEEAHLGVLVEGIGLDVQTGGIDVSRTDVDALAERGIAHHSQHDSLAPVDPVELVAGLDGHATDKGLEAPLLGLADGLVHALTLGLAGVQVLLIVLTVRLHGGLVLRRQAVVAVLGLVEQGLTAQLTQGLLFLFHDISSLPRAEFRSEIQYFLKQRCRLPGKRRLFSGILQHRSAVCPKKGVVLLGLHPHAGVVLRNAVPDHDAPDPHLRRSQHTHHCVAQLTQAALNKGDGVHGGQRPSFPAGSAEQLLHPLADIPVGDGVQVGQQGLVLKDQGAQLLPVQTLFTV